MERVLDKVMRERNGFARKFPREVQVNPSVDRIMISFTQGILLGVKLGMKISAEAARNFKVYTGEKEHKAVVRDIGEEIALDIEEKIDEATRDADERTTRPPETDFRTGNGGSVDISSPCRSPLSGERSADNLPGVGHVLDSSTGSRPNPVRRLIKIPAGLVNYKSSSGFQICARRGCRENATWIIKSSRQHLGRASNDRTEYRCDNHAEDFFVQYDPQVLIDGKIFAGDPWADK